MLIGAFIAVGVIAAVLVAWQYEQPGMKLLRLEVRQDDRVVLLNTFDAPDSSSLREIWRRAAAAPFSTERSTPQVVAREDQPLHAELSGSVQLTIRHARRVVTQAGLEGLRLSRDATHSTQWYIDPAEVGRVQAAAGL